MRTYFFRVVKSSENREDSIPRWYSYKRLGLICYITKGKVGLRVDSWTYTTDFSCFERTCYSSETNFWVHVNENNLLSKVLWKSPSSHQNSWSQEISIEITIISVLIITPPSIRKFYDECFRCVFFKLHSNSIQVWQLTSLLKFVLGSTLNPFNIYSDETENIYMTHILEPEIQISKSFR